MKTTNTGISDADNVTIVDNAPAGIVFDTEDSAGCLSTTVGGNLSCTFAHLGAGASETVNVTYHVPSTTDSGTVTNTATADSDQVLPVSDSDDLAIVRRADLGITKSDTPDPVVSGGTITYTIVVTNYGPSVSSGFTVTHTLDPDVRFVSGVGCTTPTGTGPGGFGGTFTCVHSKRPGGRVERDLCGDGRDSIPHRSHRS